MIRNRAGAALFGRAAPDEMLGLSLEALLPEMRAAPDATSDVVHELGAAVADRPFRALSRPYTAYRACDRERGRQGSPSSLDARASPVGTWTDSEIHGAGAVELSGAGAVCSLA
jgi:hypothetical protein